MSLHITDPLPVPHPAFAITLRARRARDADHERQRADRLAAWRELGEWLAAQGWQVLEAAISLVMSRAPTGPAPIVGHLGEVLALRFVADCRAILDAGGAHLLWFLIAEDTTPCPDLPDAPGEGEEATGALLIAAETWALAVIASAPAGDAQDILLEMFGADRARGGRLDDYAPFSTDHDPDGLAERLQPAAHRLITARNTADWLEALTDYVIGSDAAAGARRLTGVERMGLVAWTARRAIGVGTVAPRTAAPRRRVRELARVG